MSDRKTLNILLIEDNDDHADLFAANLALTAYAGSQVSRHEALGPGVAALLKGSFELLFIDLSLRDSSITETMNWLAELAGYCPVIVLTSLDDRRTILEIIKKGADDCLPKSELNDVLLERLIHFNLDRWQLRQKLIKSEEAYKDLYHNSPNMLGCVDAKTRRILSCNQTFADKLGYSRSEEIVGREIYEFYHPDCLRQYHKAFENFLVTGIIRNAETQLRHRDGRAIDVLLNATAARDEKGDILHTRSTWIDITERKAADKKLKEVERLNRLIIETIPDLLWLKDADGVYMACNPRFEQCFGAPEAEIVGKNDYDFVSREQADTFRAKDLEAAAAGRPVTVEEWVTFAADGRHLLLETTKVPLFDEEGRVTAVMGIGHDITERHEAVQKTEAANRAKSVFLSNMSHELRTPLNAILGYTQIFLGDETLTPRQRSGISTIHQAGEHLLLLINDILDISRIESGKLELIETEFCLAPFLKGIKDIIQLRAKDKGLEFRDESAGLPAVIIADELRLRQVLLNLLSNAVKFTSVGWCALRVRAESAGPGRARLDIAVEDSGAGISAEDQQLVFEPFLQVGERLQHREGTGLGLAISRELVRLMGGELGLLSPLAARPQGGSGPGSRFSFSIEVPVSDHRIEIEQKQRKVSGYVCLRQPKEKEPRRVLVVDDKLSNRAVLRDTLEPLGFAVQEAADGIEVAAACERFRPDIVLMDLRMPKMDGFAATALLQKHPDFRLIPVIAVTASIAEGDVFRQRCLDSGFRDYIHKPFSAGELLAVMAGCLEIELLHSDPAAEAAQAETELTLPPQSLLAELAWLAEVGEIQGITEKAAEIAVLEAGKYRAFARRVQELAEDFQFAALLELAAAPNKEPQCTP